MDFDTLAGRLKGNLFLSSMMGYCDASFCASRVRNCAMVQFGAFVIRRDIDQHDTYNPDPDPTRLTAFMRNQFDACRSRAAKVVGKKHLPIVCANVFPCTDEDVRVSARAFIEAGGEVYELNAHGGIGNDRQRGTGRMLFMPEHRERLMRWARLLVEAGGPVIIKGRAGVIPDFTGHVQEFEQLGVHAFHINVRREKAGEQDLALIESVRRATKMLLLASGYVTDAASAQALFDAGADAVGIAQAALKDGDIFLKCTPP